MLVPLVFAVSRSPLPAKLPALMCTVADAIVAEASEIQRDRDHYAQHLRQRSVVLRQHASANGVRIREAFQPSARGGRPTFAEAALGGAAVAP